MTKIRKSDLEFYLLTTNDFPMGVEIHETSEFPEFNLILNFDSYTNHGYAAFRGLIAEDDLLNL